MVVTRSKRNGQTHVVACLYPDDKLVIGRLATVLHERGDVDGSRSLLMHVRRNAGDDSLISNNLGVLAAQRRNLPAAVAEFSRALTLMGDLEQGDGHLRSVATTNLMHALIEARAFDRAVQVGSAFAASVTLKRLLSEDPEYRVADGLVQSLMESGRLAEAVALAEEWVYLPEVRAELEASLSSKLGCYYALEKADAVRALAFAGRAYELLCDIEPRDRVARSVAINNLAFGLIEVGRYAEAADCLSRMQPLPGTYVAFGYATRGLLAIRTGKMPKGKLLYERAIASADARFKNQFRKRLHWELAAHWERAGDVAKRRTHLERMLRIRVEGIWKLRYLDVAARHLLAS